MRRLLKGVPLLGLALAAVAGAVTVTSAQARQAPRPEMQRPNFLVIVADDLGYSDLGAFGGEIATPHLDRLALNGVRFTGFHTSPTCSPTRAMLLTGLDNHEAGLGNMAEALSPQQRGRAGYEGYLRPDTATLAELLGSAGYRTLFSGKWHLGLLDEQDPSRRGFHKSFAMLQASHNHFGLRISTDPQTGFVYRENGRTLTSLPEDFYSSDHFATKLIEQLRDSRKEAAAKPFFAYLAFTAPHWPLQAPRDVIARYADRYASGYEALRDARISRQVELGLLSPEAAPHGLSAPPWNSLSTDERARAARQMAIYAAMVDRIDHNVGRVIEALRETGELDNTVILFLSDNGADGMRLESQMSSPGARARHDAADNSFDNLGSASSYCSIGPGWAEAVSAPSWSFKGAETEGGTRVVALMAGLGVPSGVYRQFVSVMDVLPTFLELAGVALPIGTFEGRAVRPVRGLSWADWLSGKSASVYPEETTVSAEFLGQRAARRGDWKLLDPGDGQWRLFNIASDPGETVDRSADEPEMAAQLASEWQRYAQEVQVVPPSAPYRTPGL